MPNRGKIRRPTSGKAKLQEQLKTADRRDLRDQYRKECKSDVELQFDSSEKMISYHFNEVIRRHQVALAQKDLRIQELEEALARCYRGGYIETPTCKQQQSTQYSAHQERYYLKTLYTRSSSVDQVVHRKTGLVKDRVRKNELNIIDQGFSDRHKIKRQLVKTAERESQLNENNFEQTRVKQEYRKKTKPMNSVEIITTSEINTDIKDTDSTNQKYEINRIKSEYFSFTMNEDWSTDNSSVYNDFIEVKKQLFADKNILEKQTMNCPADKRKCLTATNDERMIRQEQPKVQHLGKLQVQELTDDFLRRLNFEVEMDDVHWQIEAVRLLPGQSLDMLETAREHLHQAFNKLRQTMGNTMDKTKAKNPSNKSYK